MKKNLGANYTPQYFLASLGYGGTGVGFFMYLMFMVKHPDTPMVTFNHLYPLIIGNNLLVSGLILAAMAAMIFFGFNHFRLLIWNLREFAQFKKTEAYSKLRNSNAEVTLMAIPLTFAMSINVMFVSGAVFVPNIWNSIEYLYPLSLAGFAATGFFALKIFSEYLTRLIVNGDFDFINNNSLGQMLAIFTFSMVSVGFAAPAAMSHNPITYPLSMFLSILFGVITIALAVIKLLLGFKSILKQGIAKDASPSLWIIIPIVTLMGITAVRLISGFSHNFLHVEPSPAVMFIVLSASISLQLLFGFIGYRVMKQIGYFDEYLDGDKRSPGSFALVCPGVAFFVLGMFFISWGLVKTKILALFSIPYFVVLAPFVYVQFITIRLIFRLKKRLLVEPKTKAPLNTSLAN